MFAQRAFLIQRLREKREALEVLIEQAPPDKEIYTGWTVIEIFVEHDEHHADHLTKWLKNPDEIAGEH